MIEVLTWLPIDGAPSPSGTELADASTVVNTIQATASAGNEACGVRRTPQKRQWFSGCLSWIWKGALLGVFLVVPARSACTIAGSTYTAASASYADVNACVSAITTDGITVNVPSGAQTWSTPITFPCHAFTLAGAGIGSTVITVSGSNGGIDMGCANKLQRITGFTWINTGSSPNGIFGIGGTSGSPWSFRIDHNTIEDNATPGSGSWHRWAWVEGPCAAGGCLIDHNTIHNQAIMISGEVAGSGGDGTFTVPGASTNCGSPDNCAGATQWNKSMVLDNGSEVYVEDNTFTFNNFYDNDMFDCQNGGRYVFRHNSATGNDVFDHGFDSVASSCIEVTAYLNDFEQGGSNTTQLGVLYRGGTGLVYDNKMKGSGVSIHLTNYRSNNSGANSCPQGYAQNGVTCGSTGPGALCNGNNPADQNLPGQNGHACFEQIGRGSGPNSWLGGSNSYSYPLYEWDNCSNAVGGGCTGTKNQVTTSVYNNNGGSIDYTTADIVRNRDFYDSVSPFDGSSGVGVGTLSSRPSGCTTGVAYWATDTNTLYQCTSANAWNSYYTPFQYPHPLVQGQTQTLGAPGGPLPPATVTAVVH